MTTCFRFIAFFVGLLNCLLGPALACLGQPAIQSAKASATPVRQLPIRATRFSRSPTQATRPLPIPMEPAYWTFDSSRVAFVTHRSVNAVRSKNNTPFQLFLKGHPFKDGTIDFDVELTGVGFPGINFRLSPDNKNGENFYIRSFGPVSPDVRSTLQYAPIMDGISTWDLYDDYQTGATLYQTGWNHVRLVVAGRKMRTYVNDMKTPALYIPRLAATTSTGGISLSGNVIFANVTIDPAQPEGSPAGADYSPIAADTRYLRTWLVYGAVDFPFGQDLHFPLPTMYGKQKQTDLPDSTATWEPIQTDERAMINLSARYGNVPNDGRRLAWLKTTVYADKAQEKTLQMGFNDEVWVFINGQIVYVDKNYFGTPNAKQEGRCVLDNATIRLPLQPGPNEIIIGLAHYLYGWGLLARFTDTDGVRLTK